MLDELLASRQLTCVHAVYQVLKSFQPGGLAERTRLLEALQNPGAGQTAKEILEKLRTWTRHLSRAVTMGISVPDASILLRGLDCLCGNMLTKHQQVDFRMSVVRTKLALDHAPTQDHVSEFARALQSEFAMLALASADEGKGPKNPKAAKLEGAEKAAGKGADGKPGPGKGVPNGESPKKACKSWFSSGGCSWGGKCKFLHEQTVTKGSGRCFWCSGLGHSKPSCPHREGKGPGGGSAGKEKEGELQDKGKGATAKKTQPKGSGGGSEGGAGAGVGKPGVANPGGSNAQLLPSQAQLLKEATEALKALALRAMKHGGTVPESVENPERSFLDTAYSQEPCLKLMPCQIQGNGLLDSGASVCLRQAESGEIAGCTSKMVTLAVGQQEMLVNECGTIVQEGPVDPIVSLPKLIEIGYKLRWTEKGISLRSRKNKRVEIFEGPGCPEVPRQIALSLIAEVEECHRLRNQANSELIRRLDGAGQISLVDLMTELREGFHAGKDMVGTFGLWVSKIFPDVPTNLLQEVVAQPILDGEAAPWNRRQRRSHLSAKRGIILNLFAGSTRDRFRKVAEKHGCQVLDLDEQEDLLKPSTFGYVVGLILSGRVRAVIGGPPCRTYSPCRFLPGGPPPVRLRSGPQRWGKDNVSQGEASKVRTDNVLQLRMAVLGALAETVSQTLFGVSVAFLGEHPRDAAEYRKDIPEEKVPALLKTPEWKILQDLLGLHLLTINQGPLGHDRPKPTQLLTNLPLRWLEVATSAIKPEFPLDTRQSARWATWAPGLVSAIEEGIDQFFRGHPPTLCMVGANRQDKERLKNHIDSGHLPYWRRCRLCVEGRARDKPHRRQSVVETNVLSLDMAGPYAAGLDESQKGVKYALVGVLVIADLRRLKELDGKQEEGERPPRPEGNEDQEDRVGDALGDDDWLEANEVEEPEEEDIEAKDVEIDGEAEHLLTSLPTKELVFSEVLPNKKQTTVLEAIRVLAARVAGLGYKVVRIHSDKGKEFMGKNVQKWASSRGLVWSNTGGDNWKANGRVEAVIGRLKGLTTSLLIQASLPKENWAFAWRYAAERFLRATLKYVGGVGDESMLRFGSKLLARQRSWKLEDFSPKVVPATLLAPARNVSRAWLVRTDKGEYYNTAVVFPHVLEEESAEPLEAPTMDVGPEVEMAAPGRRNRGKTSIAVLRPDPSDQELGEFLCETCAETAPAATAPSSHQNPLDVGNHKVTSGSRRLDPIHESPESSENLDCWPDIRKTPPIAEPSEYRWKFPVPLTSNEHRLRCEDVLAQALAVSPSYTFAKAHSMVCHSMWIKTTTNPSSAQARSEIRSVLGLFRHGGVSGVTKSTMRFPGFTKLLARMVQSCWQDRTFTSMAVVTAVDIPPHKDKNNAPKSNLLIPIRTPRKGLLIWTELQTGDLVAGNVVMRDLSPNRCVAGQERLLFAGETMQLDATRWHAVRSHDKFCEPALVLVAYTLTHLEKVPHDTRLTLTASGIPLPAAPTTLQQGGRDGEDLDNGGAGRGVEGVPGKFKTSKLPVALKSQGEGSGDQGCEEGGGVCSSATGSAALRKFTSDPASGCWCLERECKLCSTKFENRSEGRDSDRDSWAEGSEDSWFVVSPQNSSLFEVKGEGSAAEWEIVASQEGWSVEVPDPAECLEPLAEQVAEELDLTRVNLQACLQSERRILKAVSKEGAEQEAVDTAHSLCQIESHVHALEQELVRLREHDPAQVKAEEAAESIDLPTVLQTKTIPTDVALANWDQGWKEATLKELGALVDVKKALRTISETEVKEMVDSGMEVIRLPTKLVYTIKAGSGRQKCRLVLCGNSAPVVQESSIEKRLATFAGGVDIGLLRLLLADAVTEQLELVTFDISTAFLNAPARARNLRQAFHGKKQVTIASPPKALIRLGVIPPGTLWEVLLAMYGLDTSPRDWSLHRTEVLADLRVPSPIGVLYLQRSSVESSIWYIYQESQSDPKPLGWFGIYVDDFLGASAHGLVDCVYHEVNKLWECGPLERVTTAREGPAVRFNGLELVWSEDKDRLFVGQPSYIAEMVKRHEGNVRRQQVPLIKPLLETDEAEEPSLDHVRQCQQLIGELLYVAVRSRPDIAYACSRLASVMVKKPREVLTAAQGVLGYLAETADLGLVYNRSGNRLLDEARAVESSSPVLEVFGDAGFAPEGSRSQGCCIACWKDSVIYWYSSRQPFVAQSTCEAELIITVEAANLAESFRSLAQELQGGVDPRCVIRNDNVSAILLACSEAASWRTRHLKIRANVLRERVQAHLWEPHHVAGQFNLADIGTKVLQASRLTWLKSLLGMQPSSSFSSGQGVPGDTRRAAAVVYALVLQSCFEGSLGVGVKSKVGGSSEGFWDDWAVWFLLGIWTLAVLAVWEGFRWLCRGCRVRGLRARAELERLERPEPAEEPRTPSSAAEDAHPEPFEEPDITLPPPPVGPIEPPQPPPVLMFPVEPEDVPIQVLRRPQPNLPVYYPEPDPEGVEVPTEDPAQVPLHVGRDQALYQQAIERELQGLLEVGAVRVEQGPPNEVVFERRNPAVAEGPGPRPPAEPVPVRVVPYEEVRQRAVQRNLPRGLLNNPPEIPLRFNVLWPVPVQITLREVNQRRSQWGGNLSAISQIPPQGSGDFYEFPSSGRVNVMTRWHTDSRIRMFTPSNTAVPIHLHALTYRRRTIAQFETGAVEITDDHWDEPGGRRYLSQRWRGRTELEVQFDRLPLVEQRRAAAVAEEALRALRG